ncbi:MAG: HAMP domain-containing histidine kinase [Gammaproteobacteria bacterium]|nr:HAMP domain-containing histidine kinase [Gammaproteobacteria bacterium]MDH5631130.1 HAMP domain-containing histidine kinase [Gammaproteobacteria bacterium]
MKLDYKYEDTIGLLVHSYNNYLSGLIGFTELAILESRQDEVTEKLEVALESGVDAVTFGKQLLSSVSRLQVDISPTQINPIIENLCHEKQDSGRVCNFVDESQSEAKIDTNPEWFYKCLNSIVRFCYEFSAKCEVTISTSVNDDNVLINVQVTEVNLTPAESEKLFLPFYSSRHLLGQKDVGLAVVHGFVVQMDGTMSWHDKNGFTITIPKSEEK